jgi:hypothetical protein
MEFLLVCTVSLDYLDDGKFSNLVNNGCNKKDIHKVIYCPCCKHPRNVDFLDSTITLKSNVSFSCDVCCVEIHVTDKLLLSRYDEKADLLTYIPFDV